MNQKLRSFRQALRKPFTPREPNEDIAANEQNPNEPDWTVFEDKAPAPERETGVLNIKFALVIAIICVVFVAGYFLSNLSLK